MKHAPKRLSQSSREISDNCRERKGRGEIELSADRSGSVTWMTHRLHAFQDREVMVIGDKPGNTDDGPG